MTGIQFSIYTDTMNYENCTKYVNKFLTVTVGSLVNAPDCIAFYTKGERDWMGWGGGEGR